MSSCASFVTACTNCLPDRRRIRDVDGNGTETVTRIMSRYLLNRSTVHAVLSQASLERAALHTKLCNIQRIMRRDPPIPFPYQHPNHPWLWMPPTPFQPYIFPQAVSTSLAPLNVWRKGYNWGRTLRRVSDRRVDFIARASSNKMVEKEIIKIP